MKQNKQLKSRIDESDFQFHKVPPETLELNQETIDSVRRWYDYQMKLGGNTQNAHILDLLCEDILDAWEGDYPALSALQKDLDTARRTHLAGLERYLKGLIRIGEMLLEREPSLNESADGIEQTDLNGIYQSLKSEYDGKSWSDEFMKIHVSLKDDQVICWFDLDRDDEGFEEKRDCAISFYDEVVRFLVDSFGEEFKYEDPRISADYIDRNNMYGQYDIVLDDDGENAPVIAIWENEENKMKRKSFDEGFMSNIGTDGKHLYSIIYKFDGWDGSVQEYGKTEEDAIQNAIAKGKIDDEDEIVKIVDLGEQHPEYTSESGDSLYGVPGAKDVDWAIIYKNCHIEPSEFYGNLGELYDEEHPEDPNHKGFDDWCWENTDLIMSELEHLASYDDDYEGDDYYAESKKKIAKEAGRKVIPAANGCNIHDMYDCWIVTNKDGLNIGQCKTLIEAKHIAENADEYTARKLGYSESRKLVKEGAGAGYTVTIKGLKLGKIIKKRLVKGEKSYEDYYECEVEIVPGEYEIGAEDYYNDFFRQEHEWGDSPTAEIDGGVAIIQYSTNSYDEEESEEELRREVEGRTLSEISCDYGRGWSHVNLPRENIVFDRVSVPGNGFYGSIDVLELDAPDLADAVNCGWESIWEDDEEDEGEGEDNEVMNESSDEGWSVVGAGYDEFVQRLWGYTRKDIKNRRDAFSRCTNAMEKALREYYNEVVL